MNMTTNEAAEVLGVSRATIVRMINRGELDAHKKSDTRNSPMVVDAASVYTYRDRQKARAAARQTA